MAQDDLQAVENLMATGALRSAQDECKRFLQQHPTHSAAHEMMGDILYARELWEEAAQWYGLAYQLARSEKLRIKRADAYQRARQARKVLEPTLVDDTESPRRMIWLGAAAVAMLLVIVLIGASIARTGRHDSVPPEIAIERVPPRSPGLTSPSIVRGTGEPATTPGAAPRPAQRAPQTEAPPGQAVPDDHWAAQSADRVPPRRPITRPGTAQRRTTPEPITDHDEAVIRAVSSLGWNDDRSMTGQVSAMVDPYTGYAVIRVFVPGAVPDANLRETVVRQAFRVAFTAFQANEVISAITVQMVRDNPDGEREMLFRGNTSRNAVVREETMPAFDRLWGTVFTAIRWNPRPAAEDVGQTEAAPGQDGAP